MKLQTLVACVQKNTETLAETMKLDSDAIIINQCDTNAYSEYEYNGHSIVCYSFKEKGVGLSRNNALMRATGDIVLFSDEDIRYNEGYARKILEQFEANPNADMILFNIDVIAERATYHIDKYTKVGRLNCGRYPTYSFAVKREKLHKANINFSLLFGGGAKYGCGEDSLFILDCVKNGFNIIAVPVTIGREEPRPSTWFNGYTKKYFYDKGVLYVPLYGLMAKPLALRWLLAHKSTLFADENQEIKTWQEAYKLMKQGMKEFKA